MKQRILTTLFAFAFILSAARANAAVEAAGELPGIHNFFRATTNLFSGSQPEGDAGFAALARLGVKTILSVDGAKPDVALAAKHGLRYVHLPIGYDGIPSNRVVELARAATTLPGPIYVHCHHGKHRGPAAVGVMCRASVGWTRDEAEEFMHHAGTAAEYVGLYQSVATFQPPTPIQLNSVAASFPAVVEPSTVVESMVALDQIHERLVDIKRAGWKTPADHPDVIPAHEATMLLEQFRELARLDDTSGRSDDYRARLNAATSAAEQLQTQLKAGTSGDAAFQRVSASCTDCHRQYRNQ